jgi:hypothetical protein
MAFNKQPQTWFTSLTDNGTALSIDIADIPELTAAEIDSSTGDIRKFVYAMIEKLWTEYNDLATADKPGKLTISKYVSVDPSTGVVTNTYSFVVKTTVSAQEVADE